VNSQKNNKAGSFLFSFLLGLSWGLTTLSIIYMFLLHINNTTEALIFSFLISIPGFLLIIFLENFILSNQKLQEIKKQTKLLEEILNKS